MKRLLLPVLLASLACLSAVSHAAVTIVWNLPYGGGLSSNLADHDGVVRDGMSYGIIVDGSGNGFLTEYGNFLYGFDPQANSVTALVTSVGLPTDDMLYIAGDKTSDSGQGGLALEGDLTTPGGHGGVPGISFSYTGSVGAGDRYELIWFDGQGGVGVMTNSAFVVPPDSAVESHDSAFAGVDPVRPANNVAYPEVSSALMGLMSLTGLLRRKR